MVINMSIYTKALEMNSIANKYHIDKIKMHYLNKVLPKIREAAETGKWCVFFDQLDLTYSDEYFNEVEELRKDGFYVVYDKKQRVYEVRWDDYYVNNKNTEETKET
jgi:hypothetical protein